VSSTEFLIGVPYRSSLSELPSFRLGANPYPTVARSPPLTGDDEEGTLFSLQPVPKRLPYPATMSVGMNLKSRLFRRACIGLPFTAAMLFISAGSLKFWQAWAFLALMLPLGVGSGIYFYKLDPKLLERRLLIREKVDEQKIIMIWCGWSWRALCACLDWITASAGREKFWARCRYG